MGAGGNRKRSELIQRIVDLENDKFLLEIKVKALDQYADRLMALWRESYMRAAKLERELERMKGEE